MSLVLFEDRLVSQLDPAAVGKPAFAITSGAYRLVDLVGQLGLPTHARVREHLRAIVAEDYPAFQNGTIDRDQPTVWLNARVVPSVRSLDQLQKLLQKNQPGIVLSGQSVVACLIPPGITLDEGPRDLPSMDAFAALGLPPLDADLPLFEYAHDIIRYHQATLAANLEHRIAHGNYQQLSDGLFVAEGVQLGDHIVKEVQDGPIVIEAGATIGHYTLLSGPVHIGAKARVLPHAVLKDAVALGHTTKVGGELDASVIEPYTNKQHHGFLGHSYLGSWINLGAGTCNSDLKNTYGQVNMEYRGQKVPTGMQFVGAVVGDYAKTAINTGIFTGKTIGVCSMVYGFVTTNVPGFVNYARLFGQVTEAPVEIMVHTQKRMFERRGVQQRACDIRLLHAMYTLTEHERKQSGEILSLEPLSL